MSIPSFESHVRAKRFYSFPLEFFSFDVFVERVVSSVNLFLLARLDCPVSVLKQLHQLLLIEKQVDEGDFMLNAVDRSAFEGQFQVFTIPHALYLVFFG